MNDRLSIAFDQYLHQIESFALRSERLFDEVNADLSDQERYQLVVEWMRAAFFQGAKAVAQDALDSLGCGSAVDKIEQQMYDKRLGNNLSAYFTKVVDNKEQK